VLKTFHTVNDKKWAGVMIGFLQNAACCNHQFKARHYLTGQYLFLPSSFPSLSPCPVLYNGRPYAPYPLWLPTAQLTPCPMSSPLQDSPMETDPSLPEEEEKAESIVTAEEASPLPAEESDPILTAGEEEASTLPVEETEIPLPTKEEEASPLPIEEVELALSSNEKETFIFQMCSDGLYINGIPVITPRAKQNFAILLVLWRQFQEDLAALRPREDYRLLTAENIADRMAGDIGGMDIDTYRRYANEIQATITKALQKAFGKSISKDAVVQAEPVTKG
jgi:hypothetical protein